MKTSDKDSNVNVCPHTNQMCFMSNCYFGHCGNPPTEQKDTDATLFKKSNDLRDEILNILEDSQSDKDALYPLLHMVESKLKSQASEITSLRAENERLKKEVIWWHARKNAYDAEIQALKNQVHNLNS